MRKLLPHAALALCLALTPLPANAAPRVVLSVRCTVDSGPAGTATIPLSPVGGRLDGWTTTLFDPPFDVGGTTMHVAARTGRFHGSEVPVCLASFQAVKVDGQGQITWTLASSLNQPDSSSCLSLQRGKFLKLQGYSTNQSTQDDHFVECAFRFDS